MKRLLSLCVLTFLFTGANAQNMDSIYQVYAKLVSSSKADDKAELKTRLDADLKSEHEMDWMIAWSVYERLLSKQTADSIVQAGKMKWPGGLLERQEQYDLVSNEKNPYKKDTMYRVFLKKYPPAKDAAAYDDMRGQLALSYLKAGYFSKAMTYADSVKDVNLKEWVGRELFYKGHCKEAAAIFNKTVDSTKQYRMAAIIYFENGEYNKALSRIETVYKSDRSQAYTYTLYFNTLQRLGKDQEAMDVAAAATRAGMSTNEMKKELKALYVKLKGEAGYDAYAADLRQVYLAHLPEVLKKSQICEPAPDFTLKNLEGNIVQLSELKGKVVVIDFWATWCGPCVGSFPAMKEAMLRFEKDQDVKFLFVNTWEDGDDPAEKVKKFLTDNNYPFEVPVDVKDYKAANAFDVQGIPAKFVIDKAGNIRFRIVGYSGSDEATTEEISAMVTMLK